MTDTPSDSADDGVFASDRLLGLRARVDTWFPALVAVVIVLATVGAVGTYTVYAAPGTHPVERPVDEWSVAGSFDHRGLVSVDNDIYERGTVLREQPFYLSGLVSDLSGEFTFAYEGDGPAVLDVTGRLAVVYREIHPTDDTVYWEHRDPVGERSVALEPGETLSMPFYLDVAATQARIDELEEQVGRLPVRSRTEVVVVGTTVATGSVAGQAVDEQQTYELPFRFSQGLIEPIDPGTVTTDHAGTTTVAVPNEYGAAEAVGGPVLLLAGLAGLAALAWSRHTGWLSLSGSERAHLSYRRTRRDLDEWITAGELPERGTPAAVDTLPGLVDLAADTGERAIEDSERGIVAVLHDDVRYEFTVPEPLPTAASETAADASGSDDDEAPGTPPDHAEEAESGVTSQAPDQTLADGGESVGDSPAGDQDAPATGE
jgi:hypothetical protein